MTAAGDWFKTEAEFRQLCGDAQSLSKSESAQEFTHDMMLKANRLGLTTYLTARQLQYLCDLAEWAMPQRLQQEK